jgi:peptidoglycan hydrolase-like protein with peptidoglycan-binding domain
MAIYEDIHEADRIDERVDDEPVERWRQHRDAPPRPHTMPILLGALVVVVAGVFAIDALRGPSSPDQANAASAPATDPATTIAAAVAAQPQTSAPSSVVTASTAAANEPGVDDAPVAGQIDVDGCMLDVTSVAQGSTGDNVTCIQKALTAAGFYTGPIDGVFSPALTASATAFQQATGLYVDGVVGRRTAALLGIWPGDDSFVIHTPPPAPGAKDSMGFPLSVVATTGADAPPLPPDAGQGTGKRIVYQRAGQRVWAIDANEHIVRSYLVSGSRFNNEETGKHKVYSKSVTTTAWNGQADLPLMVRWLDTVRGAIGFHQIPTHKSDGSLYETDDQLGTRLSGGCQRQAAEDAKFMWAFADIGTPVYVL